MTVKPETGPKILIPYNEFINIQEKYNAVDYANGRYYTRAPFCL